MVRDRFRSARAELLDEQALRSTLARLLTEGRITRADLSRVEAELAAVRSDSAYVLRHLAAHLGIGGLRATVPFLPLGSLLRAGWVALWRLYEAACGHKERARVHSLKVLLVALIPFAGYLAYLLPLRTLHPTAAWIYANHISFSRSGQSLDSSLEGRPEPLRRFVAWIAPPPGDHSG